MEIRLAERKDAAVILAFIKELAEYEKLLDEVVCDEETLNKWIFDEKGAEVIFCVENGTEVGFALFFRSFSTFLGRSGIFLEDLFVKPDYRGRGFGTALLAYLGKLARERGYGRLEWSCLNWNTPSIEFYKSLGAVEKKGWTDFRVAGDAIDKLADR